MAGCTSGSSLQLPAGAGPPGALPPVPINSINWTGVPFAGEQGLVRIFRQTSNGATAQTIVPGMPSRVIYVATLMILNSSTTATHTVQIVSSSGPQVLLEFILPPTGGFVLDGRGDIQTYPSDSLQMKFTDGTGAGTDLVATGTAVQK